MKRMKMKLRKYKRWWNRMRRKWKIFLLHLAIFTICITFLMDAFNIGNIDCHLALELLNILF